MAVVVNIEYENGFKGRIHDDWFASQTVDDLKELQDDFIKYGSNLYKKLRISSKCNT